MHPFSNFDIFLKNLKIWKIYSNFKKFQNIFKLFSQGEQVIIYPTYFSERLKSHYSDHTVAFYTINKRTIGAPNSRPGKTVQYIQSLNKCTFSASTPHPNSHKTVVLYKILIHPDTFCHLSNVFQSTLCRRREWWGVICLVRSVFRRQRGGSEVLVSVWLMYLNTTIVKLSFKVKSNIRFIRMV